jgi:autotransporter passenger strand-loop-strand repeat protein
MAEYIVPNGEVSSGIILENDTMTVLDGGIALSTTIKSGDMFVSSGGAVNSTTLSKGRMLISSGGVVNNTIANSGSIHVFGGQLTRTILNSSGWVGISGGVADSTIINSKGGFHVYSGGTATNTEIYKNGLFDIWGGIADSTIVNSGGSVQIELGTANNTVINNGGSMWINDGVANHVLVNAGGRIRINKRGKGESFVENGGAVDIQEGGTCSFLSNTFSDLSISDAITTIHSSTTGNNITANSGGNIYVFSGGVANETKIKHSGQVFVSSGGLLNNLVVSIGGTAKIFAGGIITGKINIENGALCTVEDGALIVFDLTQSDEEKKALLSDWSLIQGTPDYTIAVKDNQETGIYRLADAASEFDGTITVKNTTGKSLGTLKVGESFEVGEDTYTLQICDETLFLSVAGPIPPDTTAPTVSNVQASTTTLTNQDVVLTADFADDVELAQSLFKLGEAGEWSAYVDGVTVRENGTVYFKAVDTSGNESEVVSYTVSNIDKVAPSDPAGVRAFVEGQDVALLWNGSTDNQSGVKEYVVTYLINDLVFSVRTSNTNYVLNNADFGSYSWSVQAVDFAGNESAIIAGDTFTVSGFKPYTVEYSADNFEHVITFAVTTPSLDAFRMPTGTYQMRVKQEGSSEWLTGDPIVAPESDIEPQLIKSDADSNADVFFANAVGIWESMYLAQHVGSINDWAGTNEYASVSGKNKLADIIEGSTDANILLMTDDDNGDALFVDDIYSALPGSVTEQQARIAQIDEIRAGFGNDIVDMTSQRFEYIGEGLTIRGGDGNDAIWANKGDNFLFGDAGNDRIVGASGDDVIAGGIGNDRLHGGGGEDVFTFCDNWGSDNVEQLTGGSVTLWFASGSEANWNPETLTYTDGDNNVKVSGVTADKITRIFGDDGSAQFASLTNMGAFFDATTERIFEESGKGILASL